MVTRPDSEFVTSAAALVKQSLELVADADTELRAILGYADGCSVKSTVSLLLLLLQYYCCYWYHYGASITGHYHQFHLRYPLEETLASEACASVVADNFGEVAAAVVAAWKAGELQSALQGGADGFKTWVKGTERVWQGACAYKWC